MYQSMLESKQQESEVFGVITAHQTIAGTSDLLYLT